MCLKYDFEPVRVPLDTVFGFAVFLPCGVESSLFLKAYGDAWSAAQGGRGVIAEPLVCLPGLGFVIREASSLPGIRSRAFISFCFIFIIFIFFSREGILVGRVGSSVCGRGSSGAMNPWGFVLSLHLDSKSQVIG